MSSLLISAESKFDVDAVVSDNKEDIRLTEVGRLQRRLESRNKLIDEIRKAYLRDINQLREQLVQQSQQGDLFKVSHNALCRLPSLDLRNYLSLYAPDECFLDIKPCGHCGGTVEIVHVENAKLAAVRRKFSELVASTGAEKSEIVQLRAAADQLRTTLHSSEERGRNERAVLLRQIGDLQSELESAGESAAQSIERKYEVRILRLERELATASEKALAVDELTRRLGEARDLAAEAQREEALCSMELQRSRSEESMRSAQLREEKSAHTALIASSRVAELAAAAAAAQLQSQLLEQHKQMEATRSKLARSEAAYEEVKEVEKRLKKSLEDKTVALVAEEEAHETTRLEVERVRAAGALAVASMTAQVTALSEQLNRLERERGEEYAKVAAAQSQLELVEAEKKKLQSELSRKLLDAERVEKERIAALVQRQVGLRSSGDAPFGSDTNGEAEFLMQQKRVVFNPWAILNNSESDDSDDLGDPVESGVDEMDVVIRSPQSVVVDRLHNPDAVSFKNQAVSLSSNTGHIFVPVASEPNRVNSHVTSKRVPSDRDPIIDDGKGITSSASVDAVRGISRDKVSFSRSTVGASAVFAMENRPMVAATGVKFGRGGKLRETSAQPVSVTGVGDDALSRAEKALQLVNSRDEIERSGAAPAFQTQLISEVKAALEHACIDIRTLSAGTTALEAECKNLRETLSRAAGAYNELRERGRALADEVAAAELSRSELRASSARLEAELKRTTLENHSMQIQLEAEELKVARLEEENFKLARRANIATGNSKEASEAINRELERIERMESEATRQLKEQQEANFALSQKLAQKENTLQQSVHESASLLNVVSNFARVLACVICRLESRTSGSREHTAEAEPPTCRPDSPEQREAMALWAAYFCGKQLARASEDPSMLSPPTSLHSFEGLVLYLSDRISKAEFAISASLLKATHHAASTTAEITKARADEDRARRSIAVTTDEAGLRLRACILEIERGKNQLDDEKAVVSRLTEQMAGMETVVRDTNADISKLHIRLKQGQNELENCILQLKTAQESENRLNQLLREIQLRCSERDSTIVKLELDVSALSSNLVAESSALAQAALELEQVRTEAQSTRADLEAIRWLESERRRTLSSVGVQSQPYTAETAVQCAWSANNCLFEVQQHASSERYPISHRPGTAPLVLLRAPGQVDAVSQAVVSVNSADNSFGTSGPGLLREEAAEPIFSDVSISPGRIRPTSAFSTQTLSFPFEAGHIRGATNASGAAALSPLLSVGISSSRIRPYRALKPSDNFPFELPNEKDDGHATGKIRDGVRFLGESIRRSRRSSIARGRSALVQATGASFVYPMKPSRNDPRSGSASAAALVAQNFATNSATLLRNSLVTGPAQFASM